MKKLSSIGIKISVVVCLMVAITACKSNITTVGDVDANKFEKTIQSNQIQLLDVRTDKEYSEGHIASAKNIDVLQDNFSEKAVATLNKKKTIAVYCRSGKRSAKACEILKAKGFKTINLLGGFLDWQAKGKAVEK